MLTWPEHFGDIFSQLFLAFHPPPTIQPPPKKRRRTKLKMTTSPFTSIIHRLHYVCTVLTCAFTTDVGCHRKTNTIIVQNHPGIVDMVGNLSVVGDVGIRHTSHILAADYPPITMVIEEGTEAVVVTYVDWGTGEVCISL